MDIIESVEMIRRDVIETAADLIKIPSRNPPGEEGKCAEYIAKRLREIGLDVKIINEPFKDRAQIIASNDENPSILLNGHIDTVPEGNINLWSVDPFGGIVKDGFLYGRGAVDMKSALAMMIHITRIIDKGLILTFAVGEERAEPGTLTLMKYLPSTVKYGIVFEPTSLAISPYQRGALWIKMKINGKSTHASLPDKGVNAIVLAKNVIDDIERYALTLSKREEANTNPTCSITMINAGIKENIIPDECYLTLDRRLLPSEDPKQVIEELRRINEKIEVIGSRRGVKIDPSSKICKVLHASMKKITGKAEVICFSGATDNEHIADKIESIVWGPGDLSRAHAIDEMIDIKEIDLAMRILALSLYKMIKKDKI
ncbi:MAG: M20 family metallopeptidase [Candidatus Nitrosocaldaceae archaeon]